MRPTRPVMQSRYPEPTRSIDPDQTKGWLRRVWPVVWQQKYVFVSGIGFGLLATVATLLVPLAIGRGIDALVAGDSPTPYVIALVVLAMMRFGFGFGYRFNLFRAALQIENDLRNLIFARLTELSFSYWDRVQSGQIISRANTDVRSIQLLFAFGPLIAMQLVLLTMALVVMLLTDSTLTFVALAGLPLVFVIGVKLRRVIFPLSWVAQARQAEVATIVNENIAGARVVKAFSQESEQLQTLARASHRLRWVGAEVARTRARYAPAMEALPRLGLALVLWYGGIQTINGEIEIGDLVVFSTYVVLLATPFRMVGFMLLQWQRAAAAALRVYEILDEQPAVVEVADPLRLPAPEGRVEFEGVSFAYPGSANPGSANPGSGNPQVLDQLSFTIEAGETVAIVGATGCGKSTVTRLIPRFYDADAGVVRIDGVDVAELSLTDLRAGVNVVTDDPFLFDTSVYDNVAFARPSAEPDLVDAALSDAAAAEFVAELPEGVLTEVGERGFSLSGGQRQRIALARGLLADPAVLVLDDATSAIDVTVEQRIHDALRRRRSNRTTILIAHRLSTIALADRVLLMDQGRIAAAGDHYDLLSSNPTYASILADTTTDATADTALIDDLGSSTNGSGAARHGGL